MIYSGLQLVIYLRWGIDAGNWRHRSKSDCSCTADYIIMITTIISTGKPAHEHMQRDGGRMGCSVAWLAVREGLGLHYEEGGGE